MNGPQVVCAACGAPTSIYAPLCKECARNYVDIVGDIPSCILCESMGWPMKADILPADKFGIHYTKAGGYAGKCTSVHAVSTSPQE